MFFWHVVGKLVIKYSYHISQHSISHTTEQKKNIKNYKCIISPLGKAWYRNQIIWKMKNKIQWLILLLDDKVDIIHWFALPLSGTENASIQGSAKIFILKMCRLQKVNDRKGEGSRCLSFMFFKLKNQRTGLLVSLALLILMLDFISGKNVCLYDF